MVGCYCLLALKSEPIHKLQDKISHRHESRSAGREAEGFSPISPPCPGREDSPSWDRRPRMLSPTASTWEEVLGVTGEFNQHTAHLTAFVWVCVRAHRRAPVFRRIRSPINWPFSSITIKSFSAGSSDYSMNSNLWSSFHMEDGNCLWIIWLILLVWRIIWNKCLTNRSNAKRNAWCQL